MTVRDMHRLDRFERKGWGCGGSVSAGVCELVGGCSGPAGIAGNLVGGRGSSLGQGLFMMMMMITT